MTLMVIHTYDLMVPPYLIWNTYRMVPQHVRYDFSGQLRKRSTACPNKYSLMGQMTCINGSSANTLITRLFWLLLSTEQTLGNLTSTMVITCCVGYTYLYEAACPSFSSVTLHVIFTRPSSYVVTRLGKSMRWSENRSKELVLIMAYEIALFSVALTSL